MAGMAFRGESKGNPVMLSVAKHLDAHAERPFAALRVTRRAALALWNPGPVS